VLENGGDVVGFAAAGPSSDEGEDRHYDASLFAVYLLDSAKGMGHGRALIEEVIATLRTNAFRTISLWVLEGNLDARRFYEATGWTLQGASKNTFGKDEQVELPTVRYRRSI
jgi:GNAT superfamily N-acetyltransferase